MLAFRDVGVRSLSCEAPTCQNAPHRDRKSLFVSSIWPHANLGLLTTGKDDSKVADSKHHTRKYVTCSRKEARKAVRRYRNSASRFREGNGSFPFPCAEAGKDVWQRCPEAYPSG